MTTPPARIAAIYVRVSTEDQVKGFSIPTQIEAGQKLAEREGYTVPASHVLIDEGISGTTMERPSLRRLRDLVNARTISGVIVYDPDRLSRNLGHQLLLSEELERASVKLLIVSHPLEQGPEGWLFFQMRGALAEDERAKILERTKRGMLGRAKAGHVFGGYIPLGYQYISDPHGGRFEIEEEEAVLVRRVFEMCLEGMSTWVIARRLTAERVPTKADRMPYRRGMKRTGVGVWHHDSVYRILTNETYIGRVFWNKRRRVTETTTALRPREEWVSIAVTPIIPESVFDAANTQLAQNKAGAKRNRKHEYLLVGRRLRCGRCGRTMVGFCSKGTRRYRCSSVSNIADPGQSCPGSVKAELLVEGQVWRAVERVLAQPEVIAAEVAKQDGKVGEIRAETAREIDLIKTALAKCDREEERWARAYAGEVIELEELQQYRAEIDQRRRALRGRQAELDDALAGAAHTEETVAALSVYCARVRQRLEGLTGPKNARRWKP